MKWNFFLREVSTHLRRLSPCKNERTHSRDCVLCVCVCVKSINAKQSVRNVYSVNCEVNISSTLSLLLDKFFMSIYSEDESKAMKWAKCHCKKWIQIEWIPHTLHSYSVWWHRFRRRNQVRNFINVCRFVRYTSAHGRIWYVLIVHVIMNQQCLFIVE